MKPKKLHLVACSLLLLLMSVILSAQLAFKANNELQKEPGIHLTNLKQVARLTGKPLKEETYPSPNNTAEKYDVGGTDLGIMWEMSGTQIGIFFGDTNGQDFVANKGNGGGNGSNWRSNVLAFSHDSNLEDGLTINSMALDSSRKAREICAGAKNNPGKYNTSIPTGAIRAAGVDYVHYMNIYEWAGGNGRWLTNFSSIYASYDNGQTWRRKAEVTFKPDSKFSQVAYAKKEGFVYMIGTLAGRGSAAYLARFKEPNLLKMKEYEYWDKNQKKWVKNNEQAATAVIPAPVGEASLLYNETFKRWIIIYSYDGAFDPDLKMKMHAIVYRDAKELTGSWSDLKILTTAIEYPGLYSPYMHPLSKKGNQLYFTMSLWKPYNVYLMKADMQMSTE